MRRVLIIDDDTDFSSIMKETLSEEKDLEIVGILNNEASATEAFTDGILKHVDCVLLDLHIPRSADESSAYTGAGLRILESLRKRYHFHGTIIVITGSQDPEDGKRSLAAGCDGYLCKHLPIEKVQQMIDQLKIAIRGHVMMISPEMRHVFLRDEISAKEAALMDMLCSDASWTEIARQLDYKTAKAAANTGDRVYDKLLTQEDKRELEQQGQKKREKAIEVWRARRSKHGSESISN